MQNEDNNSSVKLGIMQPYFFPYIGYFQLIQAVDVFLLYDMVQYIKKGWINRNRVIELHRGDKKIIVPVKLESMTQRIYDVEIDNSVNWQRAIVNTLEYNYKRTPFFEEIFPQIKEMLLPPFQTISKLNFHTINCIVKLLDIKTKIITATSDFEKMEESLKNQNSLLHARTQRVVSICNSLNASTYINPIGGTELYKKSDFKERNIDLYFIKSKEYSYKQQNPTFIPHLSIVDVLFCCGIEETKKLLHNYELI